MTHSDNGSSLQWWERCLENLFRLLLADTCKKEGLAHDVRNKGHRMQATAWGEGSAWRFPSDEKHSRFQHTYTSTSTTTSSPPLPPPPPPCLSTTTAYNIPYRHAQPAPLQACHRLCKPAPPLPVPLFPPTSSAQPAAPAPSSAQSPPNSADRLIHASPLPAPASTGLAAQIQIPPASPHNHS